MNKFKQAAAILALGTACAIPVFAQDTSSTTTSQPGSNATAQSAQTAPSTQSMGASPSDTERHVGTENHRDVGWLGLLGLAGLLGLRRRHDDRRDNYNRTTTAR